jgi:hypothetical protein
MLGRRGRAGRPRCEVHVPISPTPGFFAQVHLLAASLRRNAGALADAAIVVTVSRDAPSFDIDAQHPWASRYGIEWRWMDAERFAREGYFATALERFTYDFEADFVLLLDADTLCTGPLDELLELGDGALAGLVAHAAPTTFGRPAYVADDGRADGDFWSGLHASAGLEPPALACRHSGWGFMDTDPERRDCPPYFNLGVLAGTRETVARVGARIYEELDAVRRYADTVFRCQLAVTLALARTGAPWRELPVRFNFPNDERFAQAYPDDAADIRILHYLRDEQLDRSALARTGAELDAFLSRSDLTPTNSHLRDRVAELRDAVVGDLPVAA